jgi:hypothetical protein
VDADFTTEPERVVFNMYDSYRNESIFVKDWMEFIRTAFVYMTYETMGVCKLYLN